LSLGPKVIVAVQLGDARLQFAVLIGGLHIYSDLFRAGPLGSDAAKNCVGDSDCNIGSIIVFPDSDGQPAGRNKKVVGVDVTLPVFFNFVPPELGILLGPSPVKRTSMPKTPIAVDGHLCPAKHQIGLPAKTRDRFAIDTIAQPHAK
jgi:hypothetical protein